MAGTIRPPSELFGLPPDPLGTEADFGAATLVGVPLTKSPIHNGARLEEIRAAAARVLVRPQIDVIYLPSARPELAP